MIDVRGRGFTGGIGIKRSNGKGFTLIEIVVAVSLLGIGLVTVLHSFSVATGGTRYAGAITRAVFLAQAKMAELEAVSDVDGAPLSGDFGEDFKDYSWEAQVTPISDSEDEDPNLLELKLSVMWKEGKKERNIELTTYRLPSE